MDRLDFIPHALEELERDNIPVTAVYHVVRDADEIIGRQDGRTEYTGVWEGMTIVVVAVDNLVITAWERKHRRRRRRR